MRCSTGLHGMGQRGRLRQRRAERGRWCADGRAQGAVKRGAGSGRIVVSQYHQLHRARAGTHHVHALGTEHGRSNGHAHRQREPHQHEAGELEGVAKLLHG